VNFVSRRRFYRKVAFLKLLLMSPMPVWGLGKPQ